MKSLIINLIRRHKKIMRPIVGFVLLILALNLYAEKHAIVPTGPCSYSLTIEAKASQEIIWSLWENVEDWKSYDTIVKYSYLKAPGIFENGAIGYVKTKSAPKTRFELIEVDKGNSFTESLKLPLWNSLELKRKVVFIDETTSEFTHEVEFKGPLKSVMYLFLAKTFKKELPLVMGRMKALAELKQSKEG